ncbi:ABC transporter permease [Neoroseomonas oryzicola]|uniref:ABC transporter permease n=1 Tax=Neoroseomonas oryzicola TaxID=535904 RepID=A0A9X9WJJ7_9PROT|nr:ABC transporter permease [Neoroseomonas oryzicola]MBR0660507.1 ABC transporter permease [Neoroseomonas oryzicola]NKE16749.1 ABC transporter permease [Neoroseomonas oryzicola]
MYHAANPVREFDAAAPRRRERALEDLEGGFARWRLAWALARGDITHRYRGSVLGPFWLTISTGVMLTALGILYAKLFKMDVASYLPWLSVSLIVWAVISQVVTDATTSLTGAEGVIRQMPLPYTVHALRVVFRNAVVAAHNLPLIFVVFAVFGVMPSWTVVLAIPGLLLLGVAGFAASIFLGMICARFRDIPPIVGSVMQIAFFVSPVIWKPEMVGHWEPFLPINPFFALMETIRAPLMGTTGGIVVWLTAVFWTGVLAALAWTFFARFRGRIAFWV